MDNSKVSIAKQVVKYYCMSTGKKWSDFYGNLDIALTYDQTAPMSDDLWLIKKLALTLTKNGISINDFKINKDMVKSYFDEDGRKKAGEFYTPEIWCAEGRKYFDKYIPNWRDYNIWDISCYSMDTEIYTKRGWVTYDELYDDDEIYTFNKDTLLGEWSGFHRRFKRRYSGKMINIKSKGVDLLVTPEHKLVIKLGSGKYNIIEARCLSAYQKNVGMMMPCSANIYLRSLDTQSNDGVCNFWKMIGFYIGYGEISGNEVIFRFGSSKNRRVAWLSDILTQIGVSYGIRKDINKGVCLYFSNNLLSDYIISEVGLSKSIPMNDIPRDCYADFISGLLSSSTQHNVVKLPMSQYNSVLHITRIATEIGYSISESNIIDNTVALTFSTASTVSFKLGNIHMLDYDDYVWDLTTDNSNHIFLVRRNGKQCFSSNCGSGNLLRTAGLSTDKLYLSTLQEDDVELVRNTPEYAGANVFQLDFLSGIDYDVVNTEFLDKLPPRLKEVIINDEPLIIYANPPYKSGLAKSTDVGRYMIDIGLGKPAYDIFYQFCWRVMHFVEMFNLSNCYYGFFSPLTLFTGSNANVLLTEFERCFEFIDGMCLSAQEFSDTSDSIVWGIGYSLWKSRGGYFRDAIRKDIYLEKKRKADSTGSKIISEGKILYEPPRQKLSEWVVPKDIMFYEQAPLMTSHLTFKGSDVGDKVARFSGKLAVNALGSLMVGNTLTRSSDQSAVLSMPTTIQYVSITEENFWRCVSSYAFRRVIEAGWAIAKKEISAPNEKAEGYDIWVKNALVIFLFDWKSMMSSIRDVEWGGLTYTVRNKLFYCSKEEVIANCQDAKILRDIEENPPQNEFMLKMIGESEKYWGEPVRDLFNFCKQYTLFSYNSRSSVDYTCSLDSWDAGFQQIRAGLWNDELQEKLSEKLMSARDWLRKDLDKYGFVTDVEGDL